MSLSTLKYRWKSMILSVLIITLAVGTFTSINSAVDASNGYIKKNLLETPLLRTMYVFSEDDYTNEQLIRLCNDYRVESVFEFSYGLGVDVDNKNVKEKTATLTPYFSAYDDYIISGRRVEKENELVLPYYIEIGGAEATEYEKRNEDLLNKEIILTYKIYNYYTLEYINDAKVTCRIVGFYDNAASGRSSDEYMIYDKSLTPLIKSVNYVPKNEDELKNAAEIMGFDSVESMIEDAEGERVPGELGICATSYGVTKELETEYGLLRYANVDENIQYEFEGFKFIGSILSFVLLLIAFMNIVLSTINSINRRQWEFAIKQAMGFKHIQLYKEIIIEMFIVAVVGLIIGLVLGNGVLYIIKNEYMVSKNIMYLTMELGLKTSCIVIGILLSLIPTIAGTLIGMFKIKSIKIAEVLKNS